MGVHSLWSLLSPLADPTPQSSLQNKKLAVDASIWLHQFHAIRQDPQFQLQGFMRRIIKLRFWGVQPVIVFDGGVPGIKKREIAKRRSRKEGKERDFRKTAQKILSVQMKANLLKQYQSGDDEDRVLNESTHIGVKRARDGSPKLMQSNQSHAKQYGESIGQAIRNVTHLVNTNESEFSTTRKIIQAGAPAISNMNEYDFGSDTSESKSEDDKPKQYLNPYEARKADRMAGFNILEHVSAQPTPIEFSKQQIVGLMRRNKVTQIRLAVPDAFAEMPDLFEKLRAGETKVEPPSAIPIPSSDDVFEEIAKAPSALPDTPQVRIHSPDEGHDIISLASGTASLFSDGDFDDNHKPDLNEAERQDALPEVVDLQSQSSSSQIEFEDANEIPGLFSDEDYAPKADEAPPTPLSLRKANVADTTEILNIILDEEPEPFTEAPALISSPFVPNLMRHTDVLNTRIPSSPRTIDSSEDIEFEPVNGETTTPVAEGDPDPLSGDLNDIFDIAESSSDGVVELDDDVSESSSSSLISQEEQLGKEDQKNSPHEITSSLVESVPIEAKAVEQVEETADILVNDEDRFEELKRQMESAQPLQSIEEPKMIEDEEKDGRITPAPEETFGLNEFYKELKSPHADRARMQAELEQELAHLRAQQTLNRRDMTDIDHDLTEEIKYMLALFGVPFMIAPMEAEAQCAKLELLGLVDGVVTDDSDVFLFGAKNVYRHMFNSNKHVEFYDGDIIAKKLGLGRQEMVGIAYLTGSDYSEGIEGIGPITAIEILGEWLNLDQENEPEQRVLQSLSQFKEWARNLDAALGPTQHTRKKLRKTIHNVYVPEEFPDPHVMEAYLHPTVDPSDVPFEWRMPDLEGLVRYLEDRLSWSRNKAEEDLKPLIRHLEAFERREIPKALQQTSMDSFVKRYTLKQPDDPTSNMSKRLANAVKRLKGVPQVQEDHEDREKSSPRKKTRKTKKGKTTSKSAISIPDSPDIPTILSI